MDKQRLFNNTEQLIEIKKLSSIKLFLLGLPRFTLSKRRSIILGFFFIIIFITQKFLLYPKVKAISILADITVNLNTIMIPVFAVIITGYAIFQALSNGGTLIRMIAINHEGKLDKFSTYNLYFYSLSLIYLGIIILNFLLLVTFKYMPTNWSLDFITNSINEYIAAFLITFYLILNLNFLIEIKSFIYNLFQIFITNGFSAAIEHIDNEE